MGAGFVYVMINPAMRGLVKIGHSSGSVDTRAKGLRSTGVPDEFIVVYDELVTDCLYVERRLHNRFKAARYNPNREFFLIPVRDAIKALMEEATEFLVPRIGTNGGVEILPDLKRKYSSYLRAEFYSIKIVHRDGIVYLETVRFRHSGLADEIVERTDLSFIVDGHDGPMFPSTRSADDNARLFVHELDAFSLINCTDLFTPEACDEIAREHALLVGTRMSDG
jgi:hypothetical protein